MLLCCSPEPFCPTWSFCFLISYVWWCSFTWFAYCYSIYLVRGKNINAASWSSVYLTFSSWSLNFVNHAFSKCKKMQKLQMVEWAIVNLKSGSLIVFLVSSLYKRKYVATCNYLFQSKPFDWLGAIYVKWGLKQNVLNIF